jgi:Ferritin-like domain
MEKHTINLPAAEGFAEPHTRRNFLKSLAAASVGAAVGSTVLSRKVSAQSTSDIDIANFALTLELLEGTFYQKALDAGVLSDVSLPTVTALRDHEFAHADALTALIEQFGGTPVEAPEFTFPADAFSSEASVLELAATFEPVGVGAYTGAAPMIKSPDVLAAAASIEVVEGDHVVAVNHLLGVVPPANTAFAEALTKDEVLAAVAPFLGMGATMDTGGPPPSGGTRIPI